MMMLTLETDALSFAPREAEPAAPLPVTRTRPERGVAIHIDSLDKSFGPREVLSDIDLRIEPGEFVAIVGRSGCGKSTLLRLVAELDAPSAGSIELDGQAIEQRRQDIRIMFQDARLLPWKRVAENIALGLDGPDAIAKAHNALAQVGLLDRANEWPAVLSGGQRQRVALARALVHRPRLLLLDEPLGALDALTRIEMQQLIESLWLRQGFTALLVTHDVSEAVALADRVLLIEDGRIALDERVSLPRPRSRGHQRFAAIEERILQRVLRVPRGAGQATRPPETEDLPLGLLRFAV
ncbi:MAG TPA: ATP-binding cassette domain-containing protein [Burkholderiaceae bacterium]|jgi:sulfonate transport system ATP-binding protein